MSQTPKHFDLYDIVMFTTTFGGDKSYIGVIVGVGGEAYRVRFFDAKAREFGSTMAITRHEVIWIGPMPEGVEKDL